MVAQLLELAQLSQRDGVAERQRSGGGINAEVDAQRPVEHQEPAQLALHLATQEVVTVVHAAHQDGEMVINRTHLAHAAFSLRLRRCFVCHCRAIRAESTSSAICAFSSSILEKATSPRIRWITSRSMRSP